MEKFTSTIRTASTVQTPCTVPHFSARLQGCASGVERRGVHHWWWCMGDGDAYSRLARLAYHIPKIVPHIPTGSWDCTIDWTLFPMTLRCNAY